MSQRGTRQDHDAFCTTEKWDLVRGATGKPVQHHRTYELTLHDARILRTRISRPVNTDMYGPSLWGEVLKQLDVAVEPFWQCVRQGTLPDRGAPAPVSEDSLPLPMVMELRRRLDMSDDEIAALSRAEAGMRLAQYWADQV